MQNNIIDDNQTMSASSSAAKVSEIRDLSGSPTKRLYSSAPDIMMATTSNDNTIADPEKIEIQTPSVLSDGLEIFEENNPGLINSHDEKNRGDSADRPWSSMPNLSNNDVASKFDGEKEIECIAAPMQVPCDSSACSATAEPAAAVEIEKRSVLRNRQIFDEQNPGPINYHDGKSPGDLAGRPWRSMPNLSNRYVVMKSDGEKKIECIATPTEVPFNSLAYTATAESSEVEIETRSVLSKRQIFDEQNPGPINYHDGKNPGDLTGRPWRSMPNLSNYNVAMKSDDVPKIDECIATPTQVPCDSSGVVPAKRRSLWKRTKKFVRRMFCCGL
ncbi:unnamed protein product [Aphis gossypii]|uniref:Uncharacterized protein n=1 Tax=Aphis gossypii TaxID=80765 RepID=A0A9P0NPK7_APHGO|nr:unnamed protein product [Aphis gossypii]